MRKRIRKSCIKAQRPLIVYTKIAETVDQTVQRLIAKKLEIDDLTTAEKALKSIGYFRLLIYMRHFQDNAPSREFVAAAKFSHILDLYSFDRSVRLLTLDAIERLEVALRAAIINPLAELHGPIGTWICRTTPMRLGFMAFLRKSLKALVQEEGWR